MHTLLFTSICITRIKGSDFGARQLGSKPQLCILIVWSLCLSYLICKMGMIIMLLHSLVRIQWVDSCENWKQCLACIGCSKNIGYLLYIFLRKEMWREGRIFEPKRGVREDFSCPRDTLLSEILSKILICSI